MGGRQEGSPGRRAAIPHIPYPLLPDDHIHAADTERYEDALLEVGLKGWPAALGRRGVRARAAPPVFFMAVVVVAVAHPPCFRSWERLAKGRVKGAGGSIPTGFCKQ